MKISEVIGIDVSKLVVDVRIHSTQDYEQFENSVKGFKKMCNWAFKNTPFPQEQIFQLTPFREHNKKRDRNSGLFFIHLLIQNLIPSLVINVVRHFKVNIQFVDCNREMIMFSLNRRSFALSLFFGIKCFYQFSPTN